MTRALTPPIEKKKPKYSHPTRKDIFANSRPQYFLEENPVIPAKNSKNRWKKPSSTVKKTMKKK